jgi:hypothetical protein
LGLDVGIDVVYRTAIARPKSGARTDIRSRCRN